MNKDLYFNILGEVEEHKDLNIDNRTHCIGAYALVRGRWFYCKEEPRGGFTGWWSWQEKDVPAEIQLKAILYQ